MGTTTGSMLTYLHNQKSIYGNRNLSAQMWRITSFLCSWKLVIFIGHQVKVMRGIFLLLQEFCLFTVDEIRLLYLVVLVSAQILGQSLDFVFQHISRSSAQLQLSKTDFQDQRSWFCTNPWSKPSLATSSLLPVLFMFAKVSLL